MVINMSGKAFYKVAEVEQLAAQAEAWRRLAGLLDKLLVCYRTGRNPGALIDRITEARASAAANTNAGADPEREPNVNGDESPNP